MKHLEYTDSYDTLYACVIGNTVKNVQIETSVRIILPDLKRYDSLLKGGDAVVYTAPTATAARTFCPPLPLTAR